MRCFFTFVAIVAYAISCGFSIRAADEEPGGELITGKQFPDGFGVVPDFTFFTIATSH